MNVYIYNVNHKHQYLTTLQLDSLSQWQGTATLIPVVSSEVIGKSFAFNEETQAWDIEIQDWRGTTLYCKIDSRSTKNGECGPIPDDYTNIVPPDMENQYVLNQINVWQAWQPPQPSIPEVLKQYENSIQAHIDRTAQERGYDNGYTCASYFQDKNARYASDARIFKDWRSDVWVYVNVLLKEFQEGHLEVIPTIEELITQLPVIEWEDIAQQVQQEN